MLILMLHAARQLPSWLIFDVRQKMKYVRLTIENKRKTPMLVFVEPEAFDFWLAAGEAFDLMAEKEDDQAHFEIQQTDEGITAFPSRGCGAISVMQAGVELECGHQRPKGWPRHGNA
jgi:hypothetical protein